MTDTITKAELQVAMASITISSDKELDAAMEELIGMGMPKRGTLPFLRYRELTDAIYRYESVHVHIGPPHPVDAIKFRMEQAGLKRADLIPYLGPAEMVNEVLAGKRELTLPMIRALHKGLSIPLTSLCGLREDCWDRRDPTVDEVQSRLQEFLASDEGKRKLSQSLMRDIRLRYEVARSIRLTFPPQTVPDSVLEAHSPDKEE